MTLFSFFVPKLVEIELLILKEAQNYGILASQVQARPKTETQAGYWEARKRPVHYAGIEHG